MKKSIVYSFLILSIVIGFPHYASYIFVTKDLDIQLVEYFFYVFNNLSIVYVIVPFFLIELIRYIYIKRLSKNLVYDSMANLITVFLFVTIEYILGALFVFKLYALAWEVRILPELPLNWITIVSCIVLADFLYYWEHRLMHRIGIGWATHTVHHSSPHFNMSVAYRFGPLDGVFPLFFSIPAVLFGFNPLLLFSAEIFVQTYQAILHTEIIGKLPRPVEYLFNTPSHHRVRHGSNRPYWDVNYGGIFIVWGRIFKTFVPESEKVIYGISEPIKSVNPVVVFLHGLTRIFKKIRATQGIKNKFLILFMPPDWKPKSTKQA